MKSIMLQLLLVKKYIAFCYNWQEREDNSHDSDWQSQRRGRNCKNTTSTREGRGEKLIHRGKAFRDRP